MAEPQIIECASCGTLHEVDPADGGKPFECECGELIKPTVRLVPGKAGGGDASDQGGASGASGGGILALAARHWKIVAGATAAIVIAAACFAFWQGPAATFGGPESHASKATPEPEDPEVYLRILEDNARADEHDRAVTALLRMEHPDIVPRLIQIAGRSGLVSRLAVVGLLGQKGDERAIEVLEPMVDGSNRTLAFAAVTSITQIGSPLSESILRRLVRQPARGREILPSVAQVANKLSARILTVTLQNPALRGQAMEQIARSRVNGCVPALSDLALDRTVLEAERLQAVETLGELNSAEARRALIGLTEDSRIGWKARYVLESSDPSR